MVSVGMLLRALAVSVIIGGIVVAIIVVVVVVAVVIVVIVVARAYPSPPLPWSIWVISSVHLCDRCFVTRQIITCEHHYMLASLYGSVVVDV